MLLILTIIGAFIFWVVQTPGTFEVNAFGYHIIMPIYSLVMCCFLLIFFVYGLTWFCYRVKLFSINRSLKHIEKQGRRRDQWILEGFAAIAEGDRSRVERCLKKLGREGEDPLVWLLTAQAAMLRKDRTAIDMAFQKMLTSPKTQFIGMRGLALQHLARGDYKAAQQIVQDMIRQHPKSPWAHEAVFDMAVKMENWPDALKALDKTQETPSERDHRKGLIYFEMAHQRETGSLDKKRFLLAKAHQSAPTHVPIAIAYGDVLLQQGEYRKASKMLAQVWQTHPHPDVAALYVQTSQDPLEQYQHMQNLFERTPESWVAHLCLGEMALQAQLWGAARPHLEAVRQEHPIQRVYQAFIKLEDALGNASEVRKWVARSATEALPDPEWSCQTCGYVVVSWRATCAHCHSFDSFHWTRVRHRDPAVLPISSEVI